MRHDNFIVEKKPHHSIRNARVNYSNKTNTHNKSNYNLTINKFSYLTKVLT